MEPDDNTAFYRLGPDQILDAVEGLGFRCNGRLFPLNSYENRVYQVGIEPPHPLVPWVVAKFYRPGRWEPAAILEEHRFSQELADLEITAIPPWVDPEGQTLHQFNGFRLAIYPRLGGRTPNYEDANHLQQIGRMLGRMHALGAVTPFQHRPVLDIASYGEASRSYLLGSSFIPPELIPAFETTTRELIHLMRATYARNGPVRTLRLHADCHAGNILWTANDGPCFLDFDDSRMGPAVQDLWMFLSGEQEEMQLQMNHLLEGYTRFRPFNPRELHLIESLRTLRMMHYAAWIAKRWDDPAFPRTFTWFAEPRYWEHHLNDLREQIERIQGPPLAWSG